MLKQHKPKASNELEKASLAILNKQNKWFILLHAEL